MRPVGERIVFILKIHILHTKLGYQIPFLIDYNFLGSALSANDASPFYSIKGNLHCHIWTLQSRKEGTSAQLNLVFVIIF